MVHAMVEVIISRHIAGFSRAARCILELLDIPIKSSLPHALYLSKTLGLTHSFRFRQSAAILST